ncbi:hypothetical protein EI94DRAFT_1707225 [Lactarius quietus]|nr:hypothetical protein EI94DRAFT_1707225 [Lactarius quietus]
MVGQLPLFFSSFCASSLCLQVPPMEDSGGVGREMSNGGPSEDDALGATIVQCHEDIHLMKEMKQSWRVMVIIDDNGGEDDIGDEEIGEALANPSPRRAVLRTFLICTNFFSLIHICTLEHFAPSRMGIIRRVGRLRSGREWRVWRPKKAVQVAARVFRIAC